MAVGSEVLYPLAETQCGVRVSDALAVHPPTRRGKRSHESVGIPS
jgi:hypothetical protein